RSFSNGVLLIEAPVYVLPHVCLGVACRIPRKLYPHLATINVLQYWTNQQASAAPEALQTRCWRPPLLAKVADNSAGARPQVHKLRGERESLHTGIRVVVLDAV